MPDKKQKTSNFFLGGNLLAIFWIALQIATSVFLIIHDFAIIWLIISISTSILSVILLIPHIILIKKIIEGDIQIKYINFLKIIIWFELISLNIPLFVYGMIIIFNKPKKNDEF